MSQTLRLHLMKFKVLQTHWPVLFVFCLSFGVLLRTLVPTVYTLDSGEFVIGAQTLGIVHAPGYPLYLLLLHGFLQLPLGDLGFRGNLFSAVCLALAVACTYHLLALILGRRWLAVVTALIFAWGYYVWLIGLFTEVYAPQLLTVALTGWALVRLLQPGRAVWSTASVAGVSVGSALAMNPTSIFLIGGVVATFLIARLNWRQRISAGLLSLLIFCSAQAYFPWRYAAAPTYNLAGHYSADGRFTPVDLGSLSGIAWLTSGQQFGTLFFEAGIIPSPSAWAGTVLLFIRNFLGVGVVIGGIGLVVLARWNRQALLIWCLAFIPYVYFYTGYGAADKETMFGPAFWLWCLPLGFGLRWVADHPLMNHPRRWLLVALPFLMLAFHFPRLDLSTEWSVRMRAEIALAALPTQARLFGRWHDVVPLEYLHILEGVRPDVRIYNRFLFAPAALDAYIEQLVVAGEPVYLISSHLAEADVQIEVGSWMLRGYQVENQALPLPPGEVPLYLYALRRAS